MAVTTTARLGLTRWSAGADPFTRAQVDAAFAALEANVAMFGQGTLAARPAFGKSGRFYHVDSGSGIGVTYYDTGAAWVPVSPDLSPYATTAAMNAALAGKAALAHTHAAADVVSGIFATARLGSGTANSGTILYGDGSWKAAPDLSPYATTAAVTTALAGKSDTGHVHAAADVTSGVFASARLGTGVANATTILFGDGTWKAAPAGSVAALSDTTVTSPTTGQVLRYNATTGKWVNATLATADVSGLDTALAGKAATVHTHTKSQITDFAHTHLIADLPVAASGASSSTSLVRADDSRLTDTRNPDGPAAGHLSGTYPNPTVLMVGSVDTRNVATAPNDYNGIARWQFKRTDIVALPGGTSTTWAYVLGFRAFTDNTGGDAWEYAYVQTGANAGNVYRRTGATTAWGAWQQVEKAGQANVFADNASLTGLATAQIVVRVKHNGSAYPARPTFPPNCVVSWAGPTDPAAQAGLSVSADDDWIYRP